MALTRATARWTFPCQELAAAAAVQPGSAARQSRRKKVSERLSRPISDAASSQAPSAVPRPGTARAGRRAKSAKAMVNAPAMPCAVSITSGDCAVSAARSLTSWLAAE
jgi:hypothetical protein